MSEELKIYGNDIKKQQGAEFFVMLLNEPPKSEETKTNAMANNSKYIPIAEIERKLDEFTSGLWQTKNFTFEVVANEVVGSIELCYFHPAVKEWISRIGVGSVMIQTARNQPPTVENKIKNTLVKDFPHLKAECVKNAAKSIGVNFGRNLNRNESDIQYEGIIEKVSNKAEEADKNDMLKLAYAKIDADGMIKNKVAAKNKISKYSLDKISAYVQN